MKRAILPLLLSSLPSFAAIIGFEDFDGGAINLSSTSNVFDFNAGGGSGGDAFGRVTIGPNGTGMPFDLADDSVVPVSDSDGTSSAFPTDSRGLVGQASTSIFGIVDADGISLNDATWSFDISGALSLTNIQIDLGAIGDFEASSSDGFSVSAQIDGGGFVTIFDAVTNESISHTYRLMDSGLVPSDTNDPLELFIDGASSPIGILDKSDPTTGLMDTYTSTLLSGQSGTSLDIRVSWAGSPSGSEAMGLDNITINGVIPEPSTTLLGGLALLGLLRRRR